ncbi:MAG TPA: DUF6049 family protein [Jiangellales bacterium]|nr:DUF6049 family protein [Jiangellales bacterium]
MKALLTAVPAAVLAATATALVPAVPAAAQAPEAEATAALRTVEPAAPVPGDTLVLAGTVRNSGAEPLDNVQALLRYSRDPLESRSDVRRVVDDLEYRYGRRDERYFEVVADRLAPGATAGFRLEVPVDEIGFFEPGVYAVGVDVRGTPVSGPRLTLATERTLLPWMDGVDAPPVPVAVLWTLAAPPQLQADGTLRTDELATEVAPGGTLAGLLDAARGTPVGWLVDPDLVATLGRMAGGYDVDAGDGTVQPGRGVGAATRWLETFRSTVAGGDVSLLPYAVPDVVALAQDDEAWAGSVAQDAVEASRDAADDDSATGSANAPRGPRTDLAALPGGAADTAGLVALASAGITTVVLSGDAVSRTPDRPVGRVAAGDTVLDALLTDPGLDAVAADAVARASADDPGLVEVRQRWMAETALAVLDAGRSGDDPGGLVTAAPQQWRPDPALARTLVDTWTSTPWITPSTVAEVAVEPPPGGTSGVLAPDLPEDAGELPEDLVDAIATAHTDVTRYLHLLAEPDEETAALEPALLRSTAAAWRVDPDSGRGYASALSADAGESLRSVAVLVPRAVTLSSRTGVFPLTVTNDLDRPVLVDLELTPANPDRLRIEAVESLRVEAGEKAAVDVRAEAAANGTVPVVVRLSTTTGEPLGRAQQLRVVATDYGTIGWVVVGLGVLVLVAATVTRVARRPRAEAAPEPEPAEARR